MKGPKKFTYRSYYGNLQTIFDVQKQMEELDKELHGTNLHNLIAFNHTYLIITNHVIEKLGKSYFRDDKEMQKVDIAFARYYFDALKNYVDGKKSVPAWDIMFQFCEEHTSYQWVYMAMGVNAHVNNDLAFAIAEVKKDTNDHDFLLINKIIAESVREVVLFLKEDSQLLNTSKNRGLILYARFLNMVIVRWRTSAWKNFLHLRESNTYKKHIERHAEEVARRLQRIKKISAVR